jgi:heptosyltransferase III
MAGLIKKHYPTAKICFLGRSYTKDVVALSEHVDEFLNYEEIEKLQHGARVRWMREIAADVFVHVFPEKRIAAMAKSAAVPLRVGTSSRLYHWYTCNKLIRLSRKNSQLHEAQLNIKLLSFLNINTNIALGEVKHLYGFTKIPKMNEASLKLLDVNRFNLILHPKSKGSAREWGLENFQKLIASLPKEKYNIFVSGTSQDGRLMQEFLLENKSDITDLTGKMSLQQFIAFIARADGLVAASTGPLHIAAALGKKAIGLYSPMRPIHPGRWKPLGAKAFALVFSDDCIDCRNNKACNCISAIGPEQIINLLERE